MNAIRWAAAFAVALMSLMNLGVVVSDPKPSAALAVFGVVVGVLGLVAVAGLLRRATWGRPIALAVGAVNLVGAVVGLLAGLEGGVVGLVVSVVILVLSFAIGQGRPVTVS